MHGKIHKNLTNGSGITGLAISLTSYFDNI
nr:MAG TPA: hypothetical protein [Caudoviricetes sp.]